MKSTTILGIGIMTGTSADGADLAAVHYGSRHGKILEMKRDLFSFPMPKNLRQQILKAQGGDISTESLGELTRDYSVWLANLIKRIKKQIKINTSSTFLAIHGQTLWHQPPHKKQLGFSLQMLDAPLVAQHTGINVIHQFRQPDLAQFGQGAPLVPLYHAYLTQKIRDSGCYIFNNIGGISNITLVNHKHDVVTAFDTGPGNCLIDSAVRKYSKGRITYDKSGSLAKQGFIDWEKLVTLANKDYFKKSPPKSTGKELFNDKYLSLIPGKKLHLIANATAFTALTIVQSYVDAAILTKDKKLIKSGPNAIFICGGGAKNRFLLELINELLFSAVGWESYAMPIPEELTPASHTEALAFSYLGLQALIGNPVSHPKATGAKKLAYGASIAQTQNFWPLIRRVNKLFF